MNESGLLPCVLRTITAYPVFILEQTFNLFLESLFIRDSVIFRNTYRQLIAYL